MGRVDWSEVPEDLLAAIATRFHTVIDYVNATRVCKAWKSSTLSPHNLAIPSTPPFLMLSEPKNEAVEVENFRGFAEFRSNNRGTTKVCDLYLPEIHQSRCIGSTGNWLILINLDLQIYIFNPFTKNQVHFPSQSTHPDQYYEGYEDEENPFTNELLRDFFITKAFLSSPDSKGIIAMVIYGLKRNVAIASPGDQSWTPITHIAASDDVIFFRGKFHSVHSDGVIVAFHIDEIDISNPIVEIVAVLRNLSLGKHYLVEWSGRLLIVTRLFINQENNQFYETNGFKLQLYDIDKRECTEIKHLGHHSVFLGFNTSVSLSASDDSPYDIQVKNMESGHDMGVFHLDDGTIKPLCDGVCTSHCSPPVWIIPKSIC
ncbi:hypothetical protein ACHQM5_005086 [Ranunculus cassubicifolius]